MIKNVLEELLHRYDRYTGHLNLPGDWGERAFRGWVIMDLLKDSLGWPSNRIILGERFDILLIDDALKPIANVETKKPYHVAQDKEIATFEKRLEIYGTLECAFFTNGVEWQRLDLFAPRGHVQIKNRNTLDIKQESVEHVEQFFAPIQASRYCKEALI